MVVLDGQFKMIIYNWVLYTALPYHLSKSGIEFSEGGWGRMGDGEKIWNEEGEQALIGGDHT